MGDCISKFKAGCIKSYSRCVMYEKGIPSFSELYKDDCITVEEAIEDMYKYLEDHYNALLTTDLDKFCLEFDTNSEGEVTQRELNLKFIEEICTLKEASGTGSTVDLSTLDLSKCDLNLSGLVDACGNDINNLCELLQALIDETVSQSSKITTLETTVASQASTISSQQDTIDDLVSRVTALEALHP